MRQWRSVCVAAALWAAFSFAAHAQGFTGQFPANQVYAGPTSGGAGNPAPRALVTGDLPAISNNQVLGNISGSSAPPVGLTTAQITALCQQFSSVLLGCVPASGGGTTNFLRADGSWAVPGGVGGGTVTSVQAGTGLTATPSNPITGS